jgi:hypothetical protein
MHCVGVNQRDVVPRKFARVVMFVTFKIFVVVPTDAHYCRKVKTLETVTLANVTVLSVLTFLRFYNSVHQLEQ